MKRLSDQPKKGRCKELAERQITPKRLMKNKFTCSRCNDIGHNLRSCTNEPISKKPKGKPRRPKKTKKVSKNNTKIGTSGTTIQW